MSVYIPSLMPETSPFEYWLENLDQQQDLLAWRDTFEESLIAWQFDQCQQLLKLARQRELTPLEHANVRYNQGRLHAQRGQWVLAPPML